MSRKDYTLIATALAYACPHDEYSITMRAKWERDCRCIANALHLDNLRFEPEKFLAACGIED